MAYTLTYDEKYYGFFSSTASAYPDAPNSLATSFVIAPNSNASGLLTAKNNVADNDVYAMGTLAKGSYSVDASNAYWFFGTGYSNYVSPVVTVYNSSGGVVAGGYYSTTSFTVTSVGNYFIGVTGSTYYSSQYSVSYTYTAPTNYVANSGSLSISGTLALANQLSLSGIFTDGNGLSIANTTSGYSYGWYTSTDNINWTKVGSGSTYLIGAADQGKYIDALITFIDDDGYSESVSPDYKFIVSAKDTTPPTIAYSTNKSTLGVGETAIITFILSETSTNFTTSDVSVSGGTLTNFSGSGTSYSATFTPTQSSTTNGVISVNSGVFTDAAGNANATPMALSITVNTVAADTTPPTIAVSSSTSSLTSGSTAVISFTLGEASSNFISSDVTVSGGTLSNFSGSGTSYSATFTPDTNSTTPGSVSVSSGKFTDAAGNANTDGSDANNTVTMTVNTLVNTPVGVNTFKTTNGSETIVGTSSLDTVVVSGNFKNYVITKTDLGFVFADKVGADGTDTMSGIERVKFSDTNLALDVNGNAGTTAKIIGAVFGKESVGNKAFVGIGLSFLDTGWTYDNLAGLALDAAGAKTNDQIVSLLWKNVIGLTASLADKAPFIALLENGMTAGALAHLAADTAFNTANINLVGLAQTGIEYIPV